MDDDDRIPLCGSCGRGPLADAWSVLQSKHFGPEDSGRADVLELFAGKARISEAFARRRGAALQPRDIQYGHDLRRADVQEDVLAEIARQRPWLLWAAPPCTSWCAFARLDFDPQERCRRQRKELVFLKFLDRAFSLQAALTHCGGDPTDVGDLERGAALEVAEGPTEPGGGGRPLPVQHEVQGRAVVVSHEALRRYVGRKCTGDHAHRQIGGVDTAHSAQYTTALGTAVYKDTRVPSDRRPGGEGRLPSDKSG